MITTMLTSLIFSPWMIAVSCYFGVSLVVYLEGNSASSDHKYFALLWLPILLLGAIVVIVVYIHMFYMWLKHLRDSEDMTV